MQSCEKNKTQLTCEYKWSDDTHKAEERRWVGTHAAHDENVCSSSVWCGSRREEAFLEVHLVIVVKSKDKNCHQKKVVTKKWWTCWCWNLFVKKNICACGVGMLRYCRAGTQCSRVGQTCEWCYAFFVIWKRAATIIATTHIPVWAWAWQPQRQSTPGWERRDSPRGWGK